MPYHSLEQGKYIAGELWTWVVGVGWSELDWIFQRWGEGVGGHSPERGLNPLFSFPLLLPEFSHTVSSPFLYCLNALLEIQLCRKLCLSKSTLPNFALPLWYWISLLGKGGSSLFSIANCCARENCCLESKLSVLKTQFISLNWCHCISHFRAAVFSMSWWYHSAVHLKRFCRSVLAFLWLLQAGLSPLLLLIANKNLLCFQLCTQIITNSMQTQIPQQPRLAFFFKMWGKPSVAFKTCFFAFLSDCSVLKVQD